MDIDNEINSTIELLEKCIRDLKEKKIDSKNCIVITGEPTDIDNVFDYMFTFTGFSTLEIFLSLEIVRNRLVNDLYPQ